MLHFWTIARLMAQDQQQARFVIVGPWDRTMFFTPPGSDTVCLATGTLALISRRFNELEARVASLTSKVAELENELKRKVSLPDMGPVESDTSDVGSTPTGGPPTPLPVPSPLSPSPKRQRTSWRSSTQADAEPGEENLWSLSRAIQTFVPKAEEKNDGCGCGCGDAFQFQLV